MKESDVIKYALELSHEQEIGFRNDRGSIIIDAPKDDNERYYLDASNLWQQWEPIHDRNKLQVPIGTSHLGEIVHINFQDCAHLLIGGQTNSGKSKAIEAIISGLVHFYDSSHNFLHQMIYS